MTSDRPSITPASVREWIKESVESWVRHPDVQRTNERLVWEGVLTAIAGGAGDPAALAAAALGSLDLQFDRFG